MKSIRLTPAEAALWCSACDAFIAPSRSRSEHQSTDTHRANIVRFLENARAHIDDPTVDRAIDAALGVLGGAKPATA